MVMPTTNGRHALAWQRVEFLEMQIFIWMLRIHRWTMMDLKFSLDRLVNASFKGFLALPFVNQLNISKPKPTSAEETIHMDLYLS